MSRAPTVLCAGRLYVDLIFRGLDTFPEPGKEAFADALSLHAGGGAAITAAYLASTGCTATLMATLPADPFGKAITPELKALGVNLKLCKPAPKHSDLQLTVAISSEKDRAFLTRRTGAAIPKPTLRRLKSAMASHLHIGELATLVEHPDLVILARRAGMTVSLDCSWNQAMFDREVASLIASVDIFFPNNQELEALLTSGLTLPVAPITVVKNSAEGAGMFTDKGRWNVPAKPAKVVDTTGAGDAFNGGFLSAWLTGKSPKVCLQAGARAGARAVSAAGGFGALKGANA